MNHRPSLRTFGWLTLVMSLCLPVAVGWPGAIAAQPANKIRVVVKIDPTRGVRVEEIEREYGLSVVESVLASHGIYLFESSLDSIDKKADLKAAKKLATKLSKDQRIEYAEPNFETNASDDRFHAWPDGDPTFLGVDPTVWSQQPVVDQLHLTEVHRRSTGVGQVVAILDTGVDASHPALVGSLLPGWDYIDDDATPSDVGDRIDTDGDGRVDEALGHGTHVAGIIRLVAPGAMILPERVLDADGRGNVFAVAEAIDDAVNSGATVINMSFGTDENQESKLLKDAVRSAQKRGVIVVASAGNSSTTHRRFPASIKGVIAVAGTDRARTRLSWFSNRGGWVTTAAPSQDIVSAVPGGGYAAWSGTSMAAPFVSGQVALIEGVGRHSDLKKLLEAIDKSSHPLPDGQKGDPQAIDILDSINSAG